MTLYVIRHATAGRRGHFNGDDLNRPLDAHGFAQAEAIADALEHRPLGRLVSSPAVRCSQTLGSLSHRLGLMIEVDEALVEGAPTVATAVLIRGLAAADGDSAVCSHGDVIPPLLTTLATEGMHVLGRRGCGKGSIWQLDVREREIVSGRYVASEDLTRDPVST